MSRKSIVFWSCFVFFLILDQATKIWIFTNLEYRVDEITLIPGFLSFVHAQNPGAAFGILTDFEYRHYVFLVITLIALGAIWSMYKETEKDDGLLACALGLIMSGAVGNAIDRVHKQTVTDFVRVYIDEPGAKKWLIDMFGTNEWPAFNVADAALLIGVGIFFIHATFFDGKDEEDAPATE